MNQQRQPFLLAQTLNFATTTATTKMMLKKGKSLSTPELDTLKSLDETFPIFPKKPADPSSGAGNSFQSPSGSTSRRKSSSPVEESAIGNKRARTVRKAAQGAYLECPICFRKFFSCEIEAHLSNCLPEDEPIVKAKSKLHQSSSSSLIHPPAIASTISNSTTNQRRPSPSSSPYPPAPPSTSSSSSPSIDKNAKKQQRKNYGSQSYPHQPTDFTRSTSHCIRDRVSISLPFLLFLLFSPF